MCCCVDDCVDDCVDVAMCRCVDNFDVSMSTSLNTSTHQHVNTVINTSTHQHIKTIIATPTWSCCIGKARKLAILGAECLEFNPHMSFQLINTVIDKSTHQHTNVTSHINVTTQSSHINTNTLNTSNIKHIKYT
jgi:hypothetical protein